MWLDEMNGYPHSEETEGASDEEKDEAEDQTEQEIGHIEWAGYI